MPPSTIANLLNEKDVAPTPPKPLHSLSNHPKFPPLVTRLPSLSELITPRTPFTYAHPFHPSPHPVPPAPPLSYGLSPLTEPLTSTRPEGGPSPLSVPAPPIFPPPTPFPAPPPLEPPTTTPVSALTSLSRYPFALGRLRPDDLPSTPQDNTTGKKRTRSEMEAAAALPELSTRIPLISPVTEDGNPEDQSQPFVLTRTETEERPVKKQAVSEKQTVTPASASAEQQNSPEDEVKPTAKPSKPTESLKKREKRKRRRGPKNIPCPHCSVKFHQKSAVLSHIRTVHYRERRFKCPKDGCGQRFGASGDVTRHVDSVHLERRPYKCEDCGNMLSRKTVLYRHVRNVHHKEPKLLEPAPR